MTITIQQIVNRQVANVLRRGERMGSFDQIRQRHFWSTYLFIADPATNLISAGQYDIFKAIPGTSGQGYPTNINLTLRETNWLNQGRVPDNQNFAITEVGVQIRNPPLETGTLASVPANSIFANLTSAQRTYLEPSNDRGLPAIDAYNIAFGMVLEMSFLTNNVPLGLIGDFSQSAGIISQAGNISVLDAAMLQGPVCPSNGIAAAAFRRKFGIPIMLQHGENMGMRLNVPRNIQLTDPQLPGEGITDSGGKGWFEIRVDWWAIESFTEKS